MDILPLRSDLFDGSCVTDITGTFGRLDSGEWKPNLVTDALQICGGCDQLAACYSRTGSLALAFAESGTDTAVIGGESIDSIALLLGPIQEGGEASPIAKGEAVLTDLRCALRTGTLALVRSDIPRAHRQLLPVIEGIHQSYAVQDPEHIVPDHSPRRLLANIIKHRQAFGQEDSGTWSRELLQQIYFAYRKDVKMFRNFDVPKAEDVALYHAPAVCVGLRKKYEVHAFISPSDVRESFGRNRRDPVGELARLEESVAHFKQVTEPRLRAEYGYSGSWSLRFVKSLCARMDTEAAAARTFEVMRELQAIYPRAKLRAIETWAKKSLLDAGQERTLIANLSAEIPNIDLDDEALATGTANLERLRDSRRSGQVDFKQHKLTSPPVQRLLRIVDANWHESFNTLDLARAASYFVFCVKNYNASLGGEDAHLAVNDDPATLYSILISYAQDVVALQADGPETQAHAVARYWGATVYEDFRDKYRDKAFLTPNRITTIVSTHPQDPDFYLERHAARAEEIFTACGGKVSKHALHRFAEYSDGKDRALAYIGFASEAAQIMDAHAVVTRSDVEQFFLTSAEPAADLQAWIDRLEALESRFSEDTRFSILINKRLARAKTTGPEEVVENHLGRVQDILDQFGDSPFITVEYAAFWSAFSPESYEDQVTDHLKRVDELRTILQDAGEDIDDAALGHLAFSGSDPASRVDRFLAIKQGLVADWQHDDTVEQWMIDQAAVFSNTLRYAHTKLWWLKVLKGKGVFNVHLDSSGVDSDRTAHETVGDQLRVGDPADIVISRMESAERRKQIEAYLSPLPRIDRIAVRFVFGFSIDTDKETLENELGVDNVEDYVFTTLLPKLQQ